MNKNSFPESKELRSNIAMFAIVGMLVGFFVSRAVLSMSMVLFGLNALIGIPPRQWLRQRWWLLGVLWVGCYAVSWFWSNDMEYWNTRVQVKLPIVLLPLAFAFTPAFSYKQLRLFTMVFLTMLLIGMFYSISFLVSDPDHYIRGYKFSHVLPTIPKNDHIRFSLSVIGGIIWFVYFFPSIRERWLRVVVLFTIIMGAVYLHVLAARTGLLGLYIFIFGWILYLSLRKKTRRTGLILLLSIGVLSVAAFSFIPTLKERIGYFRYTLQVFRKGERTGLYSDMGRVISYNIAQRLIRENPVKGVGAGNILDTMKAGYDRWYPEVSEERRLIPHNQFLTVGVACGIPGLLLFMAWVFYPLTVIGKNRGGFFFLITWCVMLVPLMVEPVLEVQFGVFVYLFFLLWQFHQLKKRPANETGAS